MITSLIGRLLNSDELTNNATNVLTAYGEEGHLYSAKRYFQAAVDIPEFQEAVKKVVPLIKSKLPEIEKMLDEIPEKHPTTSGKEIAVMSDERKYLYKKQMEIRIEKLLQPLLEQVLDLQIKRIESEMVSDVSLKEQLECCKQISRLKNLKHTKKNRNELQQER